MFQSGNPVVNGNPVAEDNMLTTPQRVVPIFVMAGALVIGGAVRSVIASGQARNPGTQDIVSPPAPKVAAGEIEAKKLLLLMDTDKNGKVSRKEFMDFMAAEFDRLDKSKDGELDVKELTQSQLIPARTSGGHR
jgi:hypothetical protein